MSGPRADPRVTLRAAVIGVGSFGRHHARIYGEMAELGVRLVGLVDTAPEGRRELAATLGVPVVRSIEALPEPVDLVSVAVPTTLHRTVAEPLLRRGVHCLVEKPIAATVADGEALVAAAAAGGAHLQIGHVERYNPVLAATEHLAEAPIYVEMHRLAPPRPRVGDVGVVMDLMIHDLDILGQLVGGDVVGVEAVARHEGVGEEDAVNVRIVWDTGCVAHVTASRVSDRRLRRTRVFTDGAWLRLDYDNGSAASAAAPLGAGWRAEVAARATRAAALGPDVEHGALAAFEEALPVQAHAEGAAEPLRAELEALVTSIREGSPPRVGGEAGLRALALAERILRDLSRRAAASGS